MFILYFYNEYHPYYHATAYECWTGYYDYRGSESLYLVPGTDPEDPFYIY